MKKTFLLFWTIIIWLVFVVSLAAWWMIFSLRTIHKLSAFVSKEEFTNQHTMLLMEGSVLIFLLLVGGSALVYFAIKEKKNFDQVRLFFTTFTHDMKTSITRLLLQSEELALKISPEGVKSFQKNIIALEFQLENSLNLAQFDNQKTHLQSIDLKSIITRLHQYWPGIKIILNNNKALNTDAIGLESVLRNIISNAVIHTQADEFKIQIEEDATDVQIIILDNGKVSDFDFASAGFKITPSTSGTGIGLYLIRQWLKKLEGSIEFVRTDSGQLKISLKFPLKSGIL